MLTRLYRIVASRTVAVALLLGLAAVALAGSLIAQMSLAGVRWSLAGREVNALIRLLSLNDLFQARWVMVFVVLLMANLLFCGLGRLRPRFLQPDQIRGLLHFRQIATSIPIEESFLLIAEELRQRKFRLRRQARVGSILWAGRRNGLSLTGSLLFHFSLLVAVAGFFVRSQKGFDGELVLFPDQAALMPPVRGDSLQVQLVDFGVDYNVGPGLDNYLLRQRRSNIVVYDNGRFERAALLSINRPLQTHGIGFFQAEPAQSHVLRIVPPDTVIRVRENETFELGGSVYRLGLARLGATYQGDSLVGYLPVQAPLFRLASADSGRLREQLVDTLRPDLPLVIGRQRLQLLNIRQGAKIAYRYDPALPFFLAAGATFLLGMLIRGLLPAYEVAGTISEEQGETVIRIGGRALGFFTSLRPMVNRIVEQFSTADREEHTTSLQPRRGLPRSRLLR